MEHSDNSTNFTQNTNNTICYEGNEYWFGPYKCLVPISINSCIAQDGSNTLFRDGSETEIDMEDEPPTKQEWLDMYTIPFGDYRLYNFSR